MNPEIEDKVILTLVDHGQRLERLEQIAEVTLGEVRRIVDTLDKQSTILNRLDQERLFAFEPVRRLEEDVNQIKLQLHIA
ncbi:hypothetical protein HYV73_00865 [Candidatus Uhrbacteria bacterium]|nr:hypothetical protein [Candidatus Uhrbacteria bacterium]